MTTEHAIQWFEQRPFEPFTMVLVNGRELSVPHPESATIGKYGVVVYFFHLVGQIELIDTNHIVSFRTIYESDLPTFESPPSPA